MKGKLKLIKIAKQTLGNEILIQEANPSRGLSHFGRIWHNVIILVLDEDIKKLTAASVDIQFAAVFFCYTVYKPPGLHSWETIKKQRTND